MKTGRPPPPGPPFGAPALLSLGTIYAHDYPTTAGCGNGPTSDPAFDTPAAAVVVAGSSEREAAARAYVRAVGKQRAAWMRQQPWSRPEVVAQEGSKRAIAA